MKTVLCSGCFDIFHYGHLLHLQAARAMGDYLIVSLTADAFVNKGPGRPVFSEDRRAALLRGLRCVDLVVISREHVPYSVIDCWQPNIYCKGREYEGKLPEQSFVERRGGRVVFTNTEVYSSTALLGWVHK